uniref:Uncharacterized protein n=1 Tax=Amphimedon queenslandica TaxID=400682 RepID=A0A1X7U2Y6_AMPQE
MNSQPETLPLVIYHCHLHHPENAPPASPLLPPQNQETELADRGGSHGRGGGGRRGRAEGSGSVVMEVMGLQEMRIELVVKVVDESTGEETRRQAQPY